MRKEWIIKATNSLQKWDISSNKWIEGLEKRPFGKGWWKNKNYIIINLKANNRQQREVKPAQIVHAWPGSSILDPWLWAATLIHYSTTIWIFDINQWVKWFTLIKMVKMQNMNKNTWGKLLVLSHYPITMQDIHIYHKNFNTCISHTCVS